MCNNRLKTQELFLHINTHDWNSVYKMLEEEYNEKGSLDINYVSEVSKQSVLHRACISSAPEQVFSILLKLGARIDLVDGIGDTPLILACKQNLHSSIIELLINNGSDVNYSRDIRNQRLTPLIAAVKHTSSKDTILVLLKSGARTDARFDGKTALAWARISDTTMQTVNILGSFGGFIAIYEGWHLEKCKCSLQSFPIDLFKVLRRFLY